MLVNGDRHFRLLPNLLYEELMSIFDCLATFPSLPVRSGFEELFPVNTLYNYFLPFCATVDSQPRGAVDDPMTLLHEAEGSSALVIHSTEGVIVLTFAQKGMK